MLRALTMLVVLADPAASSPWELAAQTDGITVYARQRPGSAIREVKAQAVFDAPPEQAWKIIRDYERYPQTMPYIQTSKVTATEGEGKVTYVYTVIAAPLVARRDYTVKIVDESEWKDGKGFYKSTWTLADDQGPSPQKDIVRLKVNDGYWKLDPVLDGKKTFATYYIYTDPGGSVPNWVANTANGQAVPDVIRAVRKELVKKKQ